MVCQRMAVQSLAGSAPAAKVWQGSAACRGRRCVCCGAMLGRCCSSDGCRPLWTRPVVPGLRCPSSWPTKSHPRLSSSCLLKGGAGGSNSLAREATGTAVASEALPLPSEAPGRRLCCAELARHRSGRPMVVLRPALARHWAHRLKGQRLAVQCWAMLMQSPAAWCPVMPMPRRSKVASLAGVGPARRPGTSSLRPHPVVKRPPGRLLGPHFVTQPW